MREPINTPKAVAKSLRLSAELLAKYSRNRDLSRRTRAHCARFAKRHQNLAAAVLAGEFPMERAILIRQLARQQVELARLVSRIAREAVRGKLRASRATNVQRKGDAKPHVSH